LKAGAGRKRCQPLKGFVQALAQAAAVHLAFDFADTLCNLQRRFVAAMMFRTDRQVDQNVVDEPNNGARVSAESFADDGQDFLKARAYVRGQPRERGLGDLATGRP
jgi:hypothetical protein